MATDPGSDLPPDASTTVDVSDAAAETTDAAPDRSSDATTIDAGLDGEAGACASGHDDCNGDPGDGCETDLMRDVSNCGACTHPCSASDATTRSCIAGACRPACATGWADCVTPAYDGYDDGCETWLSVPAHCGACGHDCLGGECLDGRCQPVVLASGLEQPSYLSSSRSHVYYSTDEVIHAVPVEGGEALSVATGARVWGAVANDSSLFVGTRSASAGAILQMSHSLEDPRPLWSDTTVHAGGRPAMDDDFIYWRDASTGHVQRASRFGSAPETLSAEGEFTQTIDITVDDRFIWYTAGAGTLYFLAKAGGSAPFAYPSSIASMDIEVGDHDIYSQGGSLCRTNVFNFVRETLAEIGSGHRGLAMGPDALYAVADAGIIKVPLDGTPVSTVWADEGEPYDLVVQSGAIYWLELGVDQSLKKLAL